MSVPPGDARDDPTGSPPPQPPVSPQPSAPQPSLSPQASPSPSPQASPSPSPQASPSVAEQRLDHGASAERTRLAWRRTVLSATACGLLAARPAFDPAASGAKWLAAALAMAGWAVLIALAYRRARALTRYPPHPGRRAVTAYALVTIGFAALGGLVVML